MNGVKFNYNTCIGSNAKETLKDGTEKYIIEAPKNLSKDNEDFWRWRSLGGLDFEAKKVFSDVEFIGNHIDGTSGWAINGSSQENRNFIIKDNFWKHCGGVTICSL